MSDTVLRNAGRQFVPLSERSEMKAARAYGYAGSAFVSGSDGYQLSIALVLEALGCSRATVAAVTSDINAAIIVNAPRTPTATGGTA